MKRTRFHIVVQAEEWVVIPLYGHKVTFDQYPDHTFFVDERMPHDWRVSEASVGFAIPAGKGYTMKEAIENAEGILGTISQEVFTETLTAVENSLIKKGISVPINKI